MQMQLGSDVQIPDGLLAANALLREKPHQGVPSWNLALHQGIDERNSTAAIGIRASAQLNRIWPRYTGKERDNESGNDYMFARYYNSATGRFLSPDWSAKEDPVPYAKMDNPQSLNLYSYVYNNPLVRADADGHCPECIEWGTQLLDEEESNPGVQRAVNAAGVAITAGIAAASGVGSKVMNSLTGGGSASYAGNGYELALDIMYSGKSSPVAPAPAPSSPSNSASPSGPEGPYKNSPENADRMKQGKAPIGNDGKPVELHHEGQQANGDVTEMTQTDHRGGENFKKNHSNTGQEPSQIDRNASSKARREHWKDKASDQQ
jgi:RHS repeat-associated protein